MTEITLRPGPFTLTIGIDRKDVLTYDCNGRPVTVFLEGITYKRGLDNRILMVSRERVKSHRIKRRRFLCRTEASRLLDRLHEKMAAVRNKHAAGETTVIASTHGETSSRSKIDGWLDLIVSIEPNTLEKDKDRFLSVYKPIGILPPDQYLSVVLQGTEGCSYNHCTFCHFYRDIDFKIKSPQEFSRHIHAVKEFLGPAIGLRKTIFLADANAMVIPRDKLIPMMAAILQAFGLDNGGKGDSNARMRNGLRHTFQGINSFIDSFSGPMKEVGDFAELKTFSLNRLYLGLESGCDSLLRLLEKPGTSRDALTLVQQIKKAGIHVGVIVMSGIGGKKFAKEHIEDTVAVLKAMELGEGDILYISDFQVKPGTEYAERSAADGMDGLSDEEIIEQRLTIADALFPEVRRKGFKIAPYNIQDFLY